jgi:hypothetical protein
MGADSMTVVYGLRFFLAHDDERLEDAVLAPYEYETEPRIVRAREAGLDYWWSRDADGGRYHLLIGRMLARLGAEYDLHASLTDTALSRCRDDVRRRLDRAGFDGEASLHLQVALH